MINLMIVAGDRTEQLKRFMEEKGTFSVPFAYESFGLNMSKIKDSIITADQLLYLYAEEMIDIRIDMQLLKDLLIRNGFFTVKEIVFVVTDCKTKDKAIKYFSTVMESAKFTNFSIKQVGEKPSFNEIYESVIGVSNAQKFNNTYSNVYRVERGVESKVAYEDGDYIDMRVEPFSYDKVTNYEAAKLQAERTESGVVYQDTGKTDIEKFIDPELGQIHIERVLHDTKSFLISGLQKSGVSVWTTALATSIRNTGNPVTIIDFTDNRDIIPLLEQQGISYNAVSMLSMVKLYKPKTGVLNICTVHNDRENSVKREFLQNLYSSNKLEKGYILIATTHKFFEDVAAILGTDLTKTFFCMNPIESDVVSVQNELSIYTEKYKTVFILNNQCKLLGGMQTLTGEEVKELLPFDVPVVAPITFESLEMDETLYNLLIAERS